MNLQNELHKLKREIQTHGSTYTFFRNKVDEDLEPTGETEQIAQCQGLFHVTKIYLAENVSEGTRVRSKGQPMILLLYSEGKAIQQGDKVLINGTTYKVNAKNNIQEYNIVYDVSLEVVLDGSVSV